MVKRLMLLAGASVFLASLTLLLLSTGLSMLFTPTQVKSWARKSDVYTQVQQTILNQAAQRQKEQGGMPTVSLQNDLVRRSAEQALNTEFIQQSGETIITATFDWLNEKTSKPTYSIDTLAVKEAFAKTLATNITQRYSTLPNCDLGALPTTTDPLTIECQVGQRLFDLDAILSNQRSIILNDESILPNDPLTPDNLGTILQQASTPDYQTSVLPTVNIWLKKAPYILGSIVLLSGTLVVALCKSKKFGIRKLGWRFVVAGALVLLIIGLIFLGVLQLQQVIDSQTTKSLVYPYKSILTDLLSASTFDAIVRNALLAGASLITGAAILYFTLQKDEASSATNPQPTEPAPASNEAKEKARQRMRAAAEQAASQQTTETTTSTPAKPAPAQTKPPRPTKPPLIQ